jgi:hypothetical protein
MCGNSAAMIMEAACRDPGEIAAKAIQTDASHIAVFRIRLYCNSSYKHNAHRRKITLMKFIRLARSAVSSKRRPGMSPSGNE